MTTVNTDTASAQELREAGYTEEQITSIMNNRDPRGVGTRPGLRPLGRPVGDNPEPPKAVEAHQGDAVDGEVNAQGPIHGKR